jgi:polysaccharide biosynthesis/export protein
MIAILPLLVIVALGAQEKPPQAGQPPEPAKADAAQSRYVLGPQDQLRITVFDEPELTNSYRVEGDGFITFPLINRVAAAGLTPAELQDRIRTQLASGYLKNPTVRVEIEQYKSQFVIVGGEVRMPGKVPMTGTMTLPEALAAAGSPTATASTEVIVTRARKPAADGAPDKEPESIHVNLKKLQLGTAGQEIALQDGDTIFVPKAQTFYINGLVRNAGQFIWEPGLTVQQAIALAGGLSERGSDRRIKVDRRMPDGMVKEMNVDLNSLVEANDTIKISQRIF